MTSTPYEKTAALGHLLACLDRAVEMLDYTGYDVDARVVEGHRAEMAAGREWPGDPVAPYESAPVSDSGAGRPVAHAKEATD